MKALFIALLLPALGHSYDFFNSKNRKELGEAVKAQGRLSLNRAKCDYFLREGLFEWPCYLIGEQNHKAEEVSLKCQLRLHGLTEKAHFPSQTEMLELPPSCQKRLNERLSILDYKENES